MKIGELARAAGVATSRIRFYEEKGMIPRAGRATNGYRDYPPGTLDRLRGILLGQSIGLSLAEIKASMSADGGPPNCDEARAILLRRLSEIDGHVTRLQDLRARIVEMIDGLGKTTHPRSFAEMAA